MTTTPRTDEAARQGCYLTTGDYASTCGKQIVHIDFARQLETELNEAKSQLAESQAREAQLREALEEIEPSDPTVHWWQKVSKAISQPAPPVVPLADVKPLLDALDQILTPMSKRIRDDYSVAKEALATFTAKHPDLKP